MTQPDHEEDIDYAIDAAAKRQLAIFAAALALLLCALALSFTS